MKIKLISYLISTDQKWKQIFKVASEINTKYCELYNYNYQFKLMDESKWDSVTRDAKLIYKISFMYNHLLMNDCDYLVFIDADAAISKPTIKIEDLIDDKYELFLSKGNDRVGTLNLLSNLFNKLVPVLSSRDKALTMNFDQEFRKQFYEECEFLSLDNIPFNEGFIIIKNTETMKEYFNDCLKMLNYTLNTVNKSGSPDGRAMNFVLQLKKYNSLYTFMYDQVQSTVVNSYQFAYDIDKTFILHNYGYGFNSDQRIGLLKELKNNKWWKGKFE